MNAKDRINICTGVKRDIITLISYCKWGELRFSSGIYRQLKQRVQMNAMDCLWFSFLLLSSIGPQSQNPKSRGLGLTIKPPIALYVIQGNMLVFLLLRLFKCHETSSQKFPWMTPCRSSSGALPWLSHIKVTVGLRQEVAADANLAPSSSTSLLPAPSSYSPLWSEGSLFGSPGAQSRAQTRPRASVRGLSSKQALINLSKYKLLIRMALLTLGCCR